MKIMALLKAPLSYLSPSTPVSGKVETAPKRIAARANKSNSATMPSKKPVQLNPYRATSIVFDDCACDAVKKIGKQRFLRTSGDTPMLPLSACDASRCNCKYLHHDDRRDEDGDRRFSATLRTQLYGDSGNEDRRSKKRGRRKSDF